MKTNAAELFAINFPLTKKIIDEEMVLSPGAKEIAHDFLSLSRDFPLEKLEKHLYRLLDKYQKTVPGKMGKIDQPDISELQKEHERYFYITRYENNIGDLMVENIIQSYLRFLSDSQLGHHLTPIDFGHIDSSLKSLMQYLLSKEEANND